MRSRFAFMALCCALLTVAGSTLIAADDPVWVTSFDAAKETAKKEKKVILADFTGSDWCGWCMKLKAEVFDTAAFKEWAGKKVVLLEVDFPHQKELAADLKKQNDAMSVKYGIRGFPTILLLNEDGEVLGRSGYMEGGPAAWTGDADKQLAAVPKKAPKGVGTSLVEGLAAAKEFNEPLFLILTNDSDADQKRTVPLQANFDFRKATEGRIVATKVLFPAPDSASAEEKAAIAELVKKYHVSGSTYLLIDTAAGKMLMQKPIGFTSDTALLTGLTAALPKPVYNGEWLEDYAKAQEIAKATGRPMLLDFTGSDWCSWCKKLDGEVFSQDEFKKYAKDNLVLVKVDFPHQKELPAATKTQNDKLSETYGIQGFPTVILLTADGKKLGETGYMEGGPAKFDDTVKKIVATK